MTHDQLIAAGWKHLRMTHLRKSAVRTVYVRIGEFIQIDGSNAGVHASFYSYKMGEVIDEVDYRSEIAALAELGEEKMDNGQRVREWALVPATEP